MGGGMWSYSSTNTRYQLTGSLPSGVEWLTMGGYAANNPTTMMGAAVVRGYAPSQAIESDYDFTIRAYNTSTYDEASPAPTSYNDREFIITVLEDANCLSPINNICS